MAQSDTEPTLTSVVSESIPHLKRGAMRDFKNIMVAHHYWSDSNWNATDSIYTFETGSKMEFFSTDNGDKLRGARRDRLFCNEANNITFDAFSQLEVRTKDFVFLDWNPTNEFWYYTEVKQRNDVDFIILTYKDNEGLPEEIRLAIEQRKTNAQWWQVYGEGRLGEVEGKIYKDWQIIDTLPHEARLVRRGLDFGYTNDPSSLVDIYEYNGGFILDEQFFQNGMSNKQIADFIKALPDQCLVVADSAEPKSIDDIKSYGISIIGSTKGADSVRNGINQVQSQRISMTKRSVNVIKEYRNYMWKTDKNGKTIEEPEHFFSHSMDAVRYGLSGYKKMPEFTYPIPKIHYNQFGQPI